MLGLLTSVRWLPLLGAGLIAAAGAGILTDWWNSKAIHKLKQEKAAMEQLWVKAEADALRLQLRVNEKNQEIERLQVGLANALTNDVSAELEKVRLVEFDVERRIVDVVQFETTSEQCVLPASGVRVLDQAATASRSAGLPETGSSAGITAETAAAPQDLEQVLRVVADNYFTCNEYIIQLEGWQRYYKEQVMPLLVEPREEEHW